MSRWKHEVCITQTVNGNFLKRHPKDSWLLNGNSESQKILEQWISRPKDHLKHQTQKSTRHNWKRRKSFPLYEESKKLYPKTSNLKGNKKHRSKLERECADTMERIMVIKPYVLLWTQATPELVTWWLQPHFNHNTKCQWPQFSNQKAPVHWMGQKNKIHPAVVYERHILALHIGTSLIPNDGQKHSNQMGPAGKQASLI